jgi:hypothetical protein
MENLATTSLDEPITGQDGGIVVEQATRVPAAVLAQTL